MDTVIQFIGLFVFTTLTTGGNATGRTALLATNPNISQSVVVAIAPRVIGDPLQQRSTPAAPKKDQKVQTSTSGVVLTSLNHNNSFVEEHTTMITFRQDDLVSSSSVKGWTATKLKQNDPDDWHYVVLSGERIAFVADMANADIDANSLKFLPLRHIGPTPLLSTYSPSGGYAKAAGVFTMAKGTLSVCSHNGSPDGYPARVDTRLTLQTNQTLTIQGPGNKSITLWAGSPVFIGNVPLAFATSGFVSLNAHEHYKVYCEMIGVTTCTWPPDPLKPEQLTGLVPDCVGTAYRQRAGQVKTSTLPPFPEPAQANDYACSNTQWP
jgi:hypothetical protein